MLVRNETVYNESYLYPYQVETELTDTSKGILTVNCTSTGWPTPRIDWIVDISTRGIVTRSYNLPNYNVTENGQVSTFINCFQCHMHGTFYIACPVYFMQQVLVILFPSLEKIDRSVAYACNVMNVVGHIFAEQIINITGRYTTECGYKTT